MRAPEIEKKQMPAAPAHIELNEIKWKFAKEWNKIAWEHCIYASTIIYTDMTEMIEIGL